VELYGPTRSKRKTKTLERILNNSTKIESENEKPDFKFERINHNSFSPKAFSPTNKKSQIHINPNPNRQHHSDVWNQQKDRNGMALKAVYILGKFIFTNI
jgi:hypothetical protein